MSADPWHQIATINSWDAETKLAVVEAFLQTTGQTLQLAKFAADRALVLQCPEEIDRVELQGLGFGIFRVGAGFKWTHTDLGRTIIGPWVYDTEDMAWRGAFASAKLRGMVGTESIDPEAPSTPTAKIA